MAISAAVAAIGVVGFGVYSDDQSKKHQQFQADTIQGEQQGYAQQLQQLMDDPSSVTKLPSYQFQFDQGSQAVQRQMAASGHYNSGNEAIALTQYGQGFAQSAYNNQEQLLASLSGLTKASSVSELDQGANQSAKLEDSGLSDMASIIGFAGGKYGGSAGGSAPSGG